MSLYVLRRLNLTEAQKDEWAARGPDLLVTSYEMVLRETPWLRRTAWVYVVIDEAQRIKNEDSKLYGSHPSAPFSCADGPKKPPKGGLKSGAAPSS